MYFILGYGKEGYFGVLRSIIVVLYYFMDHTPYGKLKYQ